MKIENRWGRALLLTGVVLLLWIVLSPLGLGWLTFLFLLTSGFVIYQVVRTPARDWLSRRASAPEEEQETDREPAVPVGPSAPPDCRLTHDERVRFDDIARQLRE